VRIHDGMPDHPKVDGLSDAAFRLLVTMWCWCSRHLTDGQIPKATWEKRGKQKVRDELVAAGLADLREDGSVCMHDYTQHQRTAEEVQAIRESRSESGSVGNHKRWHVARGITDPECDHCSDPKQIAKPSQTRSQNDRKTSPETETEIDTATNVAVLGARIPRNSGRATRIPQPWIIDEAMKDWAVERGMQPQWVLRENEKFENYWLAKPGKDGTKTDWRATWRNWLLRAQDDQPAHSAAAPVQRKHIPAQVPDHIDPNDPIAYANWVKEATR
jgi:hypothetical protein